MAERTRQRIYPDWPRAMREEMAADYVALSVSSLRAARTRRDFPEPVLLTPGRVVWLREDLDAYLDRKAGRKRTAYTTEENEWMRDR